MDANDVKKLGRDIRKHPYLSVLGLGLPLVAACLLALSQGFCGEKGRLLATTPEPQQEKPLLPEPPKSLGATSSLYRPGYRAMKRFKLNADPKPQAISDGDCPGRWCVKVKMGEEKLSGATKGWAKGLYGRVFYVGGDGQFDILDGQTKSPEGQTATMTIKTRDMVLLGPVIDHGEVLQQ